MSTTKLRIHNITAKAAFKFGSEACVLKKREEQRLEAAQMKFKCCFSCNVMNS